MLHKTISIVEKALEHLKRGYDRLEKENLELKNKRDEKNYIKVNDEKY